MEGYVPGASNKDDDQSRIPKDLVKGYVVQPKETTEKIKEDIQKLRALKEAEKIKKQLEALAKESKPKLIYKNPPPLSPRKGKDKSHQESEEYKGSYLKMAERKKLTWQGIEKINYNDIKGNDGFNPEMLISGNDPDDEYSNILDKLSLKRGSDVNVAQAKQHYSKNEPKYSKKMAVGS